MDEQRIGILVVAKDMASAALKGVSGALGGVEKAASKAAHNAARNIERIGVAAIGLGAGAAGAAVKWAADFQSQMNLVNTVAMASPEALGQASEGVRSLARQYGASLDDLTASDYDLVSAGIKLGDTQGLLEKSLRLGLGAYGSTGDAVDVLTTAINSYSSSGLYAGKTTQQLASTFSDELAQAVADGKVKLSEIAGVYADVAPLAAQTGIKNDEIAASLGVLTAKGVPAAEVMTQMSRAIVELQKPSAALNELQKKTKINFEDLAKQKGLVYALQTMRDEAAKLGIPFQSLFGRIEGYKYALQTTGPYNQTFLDELDKVRHSTGEVDKQFSERAQGFNYNLGVFKANVKDAGITIGNALLPQLSELAKQGAGWLTSHQADVQAFAEKLAGGFRDAVSWAKSLDWTSIGNTITGLAGAGKTLVDAFLGAPTWVKEFLIGGFALNKFTGGAIGDVVGMVAKGLIKGVLGITAGIVNINAATVRGGGGGLPGAGGAAGAAGSRFGGLIGGLGLVSLGLGQAAELTAGQTNTGQRLAGAAGTIAGAAGIGFRYGGVPGAVAGLAAGSVLSAGEEIYNFAHIVGDGNEQVKKVLGVTSTTSLPELLKKREALQKQISGGGGNLGADIVKGLFVDPQLRDDLKHIDAQIATAQQRQVAATLNAAGDTARTTARHVDDLRGEFRRASLDAKSAAIHQKTQTDEALSYDRAMTSYTRAVANKDFSPSVYVTASTNVNIDGRKVAAVITAKQQAVGRGATERADFGY